MEQMKKLIIGEDEFEVVDEVARTGVGAPLVASLASAMTDTTKIYVYTGSESGYETGHWYYFNGSAWTDGGIYQSRGIAANSVTGAKLSSVIKSTLLNLVQHVAYADENGQSYYQSLYNALYDVNIESISAVFAQGTAVIYDTDSLDTLKQYLTVTAHFEDDTEVAVTDYTLSGTLAEGVSTITVTYGDKTTTFNVVVTENVPFWHIGEGIVQRNNNVIGIAGSPTNTRAIYVMPAGDKPFTRQTSAISVFVDSEYYLIPIPSGVTGITFKTTDSNVYGAVYAIKYDSTLESKWRKLEQIGWANSESTFTLPSGTEYWTAALKHGSAGTADVTTADTQKVSFEYVY